MVSLILYGVVGIMVAFVAGIRTIRPTQRGLVERLGKYNRFASQGFNWIIPLIDNMVVVNTTEMMVDATRQQIITKDKLNASVDAQVYFKVKQDEDSVKRSQYSVNDYRLQIVSIARTSLRNIIGTMNLTEANSDRDKINKSLYETLSKETKSWGIEIVRTELKEIDPPEDVQETMNQVVKAENQKSAAIDFATARETEADGIKRAAIKSAEGEKQSTILKAEGEARAKVKIAEGEASAIQKVNTALTTYFKDNAIIFKQLEVVENSLRNNSKILFTEKGISPVVVLGAENTLPFPLAKKTK